MQMCGVRPDVVARAAYILGQLQSRAPISAAADALQPARSRVYEGWVRALAGLPLPTGGDDNALPERSDAEARDTTQVLEFLQRVADESKELMS